MINLELYKIFVIVAEKKSINKAGKILDITPLTINKCIKKLETQLEIKLFKKCKKSLVLTEQGNDLYTKLKDPITEILSIDNQFNSIKSINIGSHNHLLNNIFGSCINKFNLEFPKIKLNFKNLETYKMLDLLETKDLDIVFSKKVDINNYNNLKYIKIGCLNNIFIINKDSFLANKVLTKNDFKNKTIYVPKTSDTTLNNFLTSMDNHNLNIKYAKYNTIIKYVTQNLIIGFVTKEYLSEKLLKKYNLVELNTTFDLKPVEFGLYINTNRFKELNDLIRIIKSHFFFKEF